MKNIICAIGLIVTLLYCGVVQAQKTTQPTSICMLPKAVLDLPAKAKLYFSQEPKINETVNIIFEITPQWNIDALSTTLSVDGAQILGNHYIVTREGKQHQRRDKVSTNAKKGVTYKYNIKIKVISSPLQIGAHTTGTIGEGYIGEDGYPCKYGVLYGPSLYRVLVDEKTGQMGTAGELKAKNPAAWGYDPFEGAHHDVGSIFSKNESRIKEMREINPELTDWEALYLWHDACWTPREGNMTEPEIAGELLKRGWLAKHRKEFGSGKVLLKSEERIDWLIKNGLLKKKKLKDGKEGYLLNENTTPFEGKSPLTSTFVDGTYLFRKHRYNKDTGLSVTADEKGINKAVAAIWAWNQTLGGPKTIKGRCFIDANGYYTTYVDLASGSLWRIWAVLYPIGPNSTNALDCAIKVSNPDPAYGGFGWKLPEDTTLFRFTCDSMLFNVTPGIDRHFGVIVTDTYPAYTQGSG